MSEDEREKLEVIDSRVGMIRRQFHRVTDLLTALFERQMDLEELIKDFAALCKNVEDASNCEEAKHDAWFAQNDKLQARAKELLEQTVK